MSARRCPKCKTVYSDAARFCPKDGSMLVEVQAPPAPPQPPPSAAKPTSGGGGTKVRTPPVAAKGISLDRASTLSNQVLDTRYQVLQKLGEGGMSYVYLAREVASGEEVAIKVLSPKLASDRSSVERLRREAGLAMRLDHLLSDREVKGGPMDVATGVPILRQVCAGLQHAHELQIVHRDLKPENIMLVPQDGGGDRAVVMDFGLAKERRADPAIQKLTATGIILGTPEFMSPEQIRGRPLDARSDVYALGIVAFEMFTGKLPFQGRNAQEMMIARLRGTPMLLRHVRPDLPAGLERALAKSLETSADARYATALEFAEALTQAVEGGGGGAGSGGGGGGLFGKIKEKFT